MNIAVSAILCIGISYIIGSINLSYFLSKMNGYDIREHGSKNAGASNVIIIMGKKIGVFVALVDIFKAFLAVLLSGFLFEDLTYAKEFAAVAVILGHIFPWYMGFRGGKGFASLGGAILALDCRLFVILLIIVLFIALITDYICFAPMSASVMFPVVYGLVNRSLVSGAILLIPAVFIIYRHQENLRRIKAGEELRFSFLWNRKAEAERFGVVDDDGKSFPFELEHRKQEEVSAHVTNHPGTGKNQTL